MNRAELPEVVVRAYRCSRSSDRITGRMDRIAAHNPVLMSSLESSCASCYPVQKSENASVSWR